MNDYQITEAMIAKGGSFVSSLARTFRKADPVNKRKIKATWPELWETYSEMAERDRLREINAELLAVLEDIARGPLQEPQPFEEYAKIRARKAIAKATGEESA